MQQRVCPHPKSRTEAPAGRDAGWAGATWGQGLLQGPKFSGARRCFPTPPATVCIVQGPGPSHWTEATSPRPPVPVLGFLAAAPQGD